MNDFIRDIYRKGDYGEIIYSFEGKITDDSINDVSREAENSLITAELKPAILRKVYRVTVESIQNLYHHVEKDHKENDIMFAVFLLAKTEENINVSTGNFVKKDQCRLLRDRFDQVNALDAEELKLLYREILGNEEFTKKGGGGLGLVDIARKTGNQLNYHFHDYNNDYSFLTLHLSFSRNQ
jgi:hypothetical protein